MSAPGWMRRRLRLRRRENGAVALLVCALSIMLLMLAALSVDIGLQVNMKHQLRTTLDSAAQAGASKLPGSTADASTTALAFAVAHDPSATGANKPNVDFWCIVASSGTTPYTVDTTQIPVTCNPGTAPYTVGSNYKSTGRKVSCSAILCAIPCVTPTPNNASPPIACNTIRVYQGRDVPFTFAPAGGISRGNTGSLVSVACKGSCGTIAPNPMDIMVVADRTPSMESADLTKMIAGIKGMFTAMTPSQQYVALATIGRSAVTSPQTSGNCGTSSSPAGLTYPSSSVTSGSWTPIAFRNDYLTSTGTANTSSALVKGVDCLSNASTAQQTLLATPLKAAARYLLGSGYTTNNIGSLPTRSSTPQKVLIFETDGQPFETPATAGSTSLTTTSEVYSNYNDNTTSSRTSGNTTTNTITLTGGNKACSNLLDVATAAKQAGILVIVVGYNMVYSNTQANQNEQIGGWPKRCTDYDGYPTGAGYYLSTQTWTTTSTSNGRTTKNVYVKQSTSLVSSILAQAASPMANGTATTAQNTCSTDAERKTENTDGDYFFCAASGDDMAPIFKTALTQATNGIKLINMP